MTNKVRVVGAIASKSGVTLFLENGQEHNLKLESLQAKAILDEAIPKLARHRVVEIDLDAMSVTDRLEKKSGGFLRFVREKVAKVGNFFHFGDKPGFTRGPSIKPGQVAAEVAPTQPVEEVETLVAYVGDIRVPGVEKLHAQMERAAYGESYPGFELFMKRIAAVIDKRNHSIQELLHFMEKGDLPIADDGSIIGYKVLTTAPGVTDQFLDCHTRKVTQRLGSYVHMAAASVDPSRRTQCSTGLHIARRRYLRHFGGNIITLVKVAPEDIIAVPFGEPDKMRAAAYHIIKVLPERVHQILRADKPMTSDPEAARILADAIAGRHIGVIEKVFIGGANGADVTVTPVDGAAPVSEVVGAVEAKALDDAVQVSIRDIRKTAEAAMDAPDDEVDETEGELEAEVQAKEAAQAAETPVEPAKPAPVKKARAKKAKAPAKPAAKKEAPAAPAEGVKPESELPENWRKALKLLDQGLSGREVAQQVTICRKTLGKLKKTYRS